MSDFRIQEAGRLARGARSAAARGDHRNAEHLLFVAKLKAAAAAKETEAPAFGKVTASHEEARGMEDALTSAMSILRKSFDLPTPQVIDPRHSLKSQGL